VVAIAAAAIFGPRTQKILSGGRSARPCGLPLCLPGGAPPTIPDPELYGSGYGTKLT